jgi:hypothetical protein
VREFRSHGSERGAASNDRPYRTSLRVLSVMTDAVEKVVDLSDFLPEGRSGSINRRPRRHLEKAGGAHALRNSYTSSFGRWTEQAQCHCFKVLNNRGEVELIASARKSS